MLMVLKKSFVGPITHLDVGLRTTEKPTCMIRYCSSKNVQDSRFLGGRSKKIGVRNRAQRSKAAPFRFPPGVRVVERCSSPRRGTQRKSVAPGGDQDEGKKKKPHVRFTLGGMSCRRLWFVPSLRCLCSSLINEHNLSQESTPLVVAYRSILAYAQYCSKDGVALKVPSLARNKSTALFSSADPYPGAPDR